MHPIKPLLLIITAFVGGLLPITATIGTGFDMEIGMQLVENLSSAERRLTFACGTSDFYPCSNFVIESTHTIDDDRITVRFTGIFRPSACTRAPGPATARIDLGVLQGRVYELEILVGTTKSTGQLIVSDSSFRVIILEKSLVTFVNPILMRVPENAIFGAVHYHTLSTSPMAAAFIDSLISLGATPERFPEGDYGGFEIEANGAIRQTYDGGYLHTQRFIFSFPHSTATVEEVVRNFGKQYPDLLHITLYASKGETFYSWVH